MIKISQYASTIIYNGVSLNVSDLIPVRVQKTRKVIIGKTLTQVSIIGLNAQQWELQISGIIYGTTVANLSTNRADIEGLDTVTPYLFTDGIHNGTYIVNPKSLIISDTADNVGSKYDYRMKLIQE